MARRIISRTAPVPPFVVFGLLMLVVVMLFPPLVTWLPALLFGK